MQCCPCISLSWYFESLFVKFERGVPAPEVLVMAHCTAFLVNSQPGVSDAPYQTLRKDSCSVDGGCKEVCFSEMREKIKCAGKVYSQVLWEGQYFGLELQERVPEIGGIFEEGTKGWVRFCQVAVGAGKGHFKGEAYAENKRFQVWLKWMV